MIITRGNPAWANTGIGSSTNVAAKSTDYSMLPKVRALISNTSADGAVFSLPSTDKTGKGKIDHFHIITNKSVVERSPSDQIHNVSCVVKTAVDLYVEVFVSDGINLWYQKMDQLIFL
ncbi:MAG: hypothetical protein ACERIH_11450 [Labilibaculum antarcticum]